jgi:tetratricopeptide (TPR) repeat protein
MVTSRRTAQSCRISIFSKIQGNKDLKIMNLILDALKKSRQPGSPAQESTSPHDARLAGQNLFSAKAPRQSRRKWLFSLSASIILIAMGAGWYLAAAGSNTLLRPEPPFNTPPVFETAKPVLPLVNPAKPINNDPKVRPAPAHKPDAPIETPGMIKIEALHEQDTSLNEAYLAYRNGKLGEAQRQYQALHDKEPENCDALLGLAAISQQRGENLLALQYYTQVLKLDPRNATANAGMYALNTDERSESRLKTLLEAQGNSAALHFALGNLYAEQSRWGEAQQAYANAYLLEPDSSEYAFNLAVSTEHGAQKKLAAQYYQRAIQLDQSHTAGFDHAHISQRAEMLIQQ